MRHQLFYSEMYNPAENSEIKLIKYSRGSFIYEINYYDL